MTNESVAAAVEKLREAIAITICNLPLFCSTHQLLRFAGLWRAPLHSCHSSSADSCPLQSVIRFTALITAATRILVSIDYIGGFIRYP
jgi:hypothetical protein